MYRKICMYETDVTHKTPEFILLIKLQVSDTYIHVHIKEAIIFTYTPMN